MTSSGVNDETTRKLLVTTHKTPNPSVPNHQWQQLALLCLLIGGLQSLVLKTWRKFKAVIGGMLCVCQWLKVCTPCSLLGPGLVGEHWTTVNFRSAAHITWGTPAIWAVLINELSSKRNAQEMYLKETIFNCVSLML